jgi:hypothetical protein
LRHGESHANVDINQHEFVPDYAFDLTPKGVEQARQAGGEIKRLIGNETVHAQDWGHLRSPHINKKIDRERDDFGPFYYRIPGRRVRR